MPQSRSRLALSVDVAAPLAMRFEDPVAKERFVSIQRQIPVFGLALDGYRTRYGAVGVDQLVGREGRAALLALVAVGAVVAAVRACAYYIAVGKKGLRILVIVLHRCLLDELALVVELAEEIRRRRAVRRRRGARIYVEGYAQTFERRFYDRVVAVDDLLRRDTLLARLDRYGHAVFVAAAYRYDVGSAEPQITRIYVRRYVDACQMTYMYRSVGIGQRRCNQITFILFCHI